MTLNIVSGCSGVGKSTYINQHKKSNSVIVSPDQERREHGSVNDQSFSSQAFKNCFTKLNNLPDNTEDVYFDATSLRVSALTDIYNAIKPSLKKDLKINLILFEKSADWQWCWNNIQKDISNKVDRSNTPLEVVKNMSERYKSFVNSPALKNWIKLHDANVIKVVGK